MSKPSLSFYTNIPTPYQISFFRELARYFSLTVIFYSVTEQDRLWKFNLDKENFKVVVLKDNFIAKWLQRWIIDFHFSWSIFHISLRDKSNFIIVGGAYWIPNAIVAMLFGKIKSRKVAYFSEPLYDVKSKLKYCIKWLFLRILNLCCKAIFCVSKNAGTSFKQYQVTPPQFIVPYNIEASTFKDLNTEKLIKYAAKYKPNHELIILSSGSLIYRKGMDILIRALKGIPYAGLRLIIIGEGEMRDELLALCNSDERVVLAGFQPPEELPYFFAISDIFAFASRYDGWAVVINEAIAANVPIVSSNKVGAAVELFTSEELGILCESDNVDQFKFAIESLVLDEKKRAKIKESSISLIPFISSSYYAGQVYDIFQHRI